MSSFNRGTAEKHHWVSRKSEEKEKERKIKKVKKNEKLSSVILLSFPLRHDIAKGRKGTEICVCLATIELNDVRKWYEYIFIHLSFTSSFAKQEQSVFHIILKTFVLYIYFTGCYCHTILLCFTSQLCKTKY